MNTYNHVNKFVDKFDEFIDLKNVVLLITTLPNFLKYNPPCKECLIQPVCLEEKVHDITPWIYIRICPKLNEFVVMSDFVELQLG